MIHIRVDQTRCQRYGHCVLEAPDLFQLDPTGELDHQASADDERLEDAEAAADVCPMQAITLHHATPAER